MATTLTTSYKQIFSFKASTYATIKVFAKATQNTSANTSTISMYATLTGTGNSGSFSSGTLKYTLDGQTQSYSLGSTSYGGKTITYNTLTKTRSHASDGTYTNKTISVSISTTGSPNGSGSGTINCATIPRQNTITSVSEADIGSNINIVIGNNSSSFKNTVTWSCNSLSGTVVTTNGTTLDKVASGTYTWKVPTSILATIPNSSSATITLTNTTYSGTTQIGTTTTATTKANVPNSSRPTLSLVSKVETDESVINALPSSATNFTEPIINLSKPSFTFTARALDGATLNWLYLTTSSSTKAIQLSGTTQTITYTFENPMTSPIVTFDLFDSRGLTTNTPYTFDGTSLARTYDKPVFKTVEIERPSITYSTVEGKITGSYTVENIDGVTGNSVSLGYQYKEVNEENYSSIVWLENDITYDTTNGTWAYEGTMGSFAEYDKSYYVKLILGDQVVDSTIEYVFMLRKSIPTMSLGENDMQVNGELYLADNNGENKIRVGHIVNGQRMLMCSGTGGTSGVYIKLCHISLSSHNQGRFNNFRIFIGDGNNGRVDQQAYIDLTLQQGYMGSEGGRFGGTWELHSMKTGFKLSNTNILVISDTNLEYDVWFYTTRTYCRPSYIYNVDEGTTITHIGNVTQTNAPSGTAILCEGVEVQTKDTGWQDFSWRNSSYTTGNTYTQNKWRVKNGVLYIQVGAGSTSAINTSAEIEIARIPITGNTSFNNASTRIWNGAVGSGGATAGFIVMQNANYISVYLKAHLNSSFYAGNWYSTHFAIPLDSTSSIL